MEWGMRRHKKRGEKGAKNDLHFSCSYIAKRSSLNLLPIKLIFKLRKEFASYWVYSREKSCVVWIDHAACIGEEKNDALRYMKLYIDYMKIYYVQL